VSLDSSPAQTSLNVKTKPYLFEPLCFLDIEMTDTDPQKGKVAEIAVYITSGDLRQQFLLANFVIKLDLSEVTRNDEVVKRFTKSGLWQDLQNPEKVTPLVEAEELIIKQLEEYGICRGQVPSAGIQAYNDRICLEREMPSFNKFLNFT
jgi:oligoribonuclease (3'-5' exoribonuclease)